MEILQNTILKLIVRQGTDLDRKSVVLASGEPGFTTDTKRLFIGTPDSLSGGVVVGNICHTSTTDITTLSPSPLVGDFVFNTDKNTLYRCKEDNGSNLSSWETVGIVYTAGDNYIALSGANNALYLNPLSAGSVSSDLLGSSLTLTSTGKININSNNTITVLSGGLIASNGTTDITGIPTSPLSSNIIIQSTQIYAKLNGLSAHPLSAYSGSGSTLSCLNFHKNMTDVVRLSVGHYKFYYNSLSTLNLIPNVQSFMGYPDATNPYYVDGDPTFNIIPSINLSSCEVQTSTLKRDSPGGAYTGALPIDAMFSLHIAY